MSAGRSIRGIGVFEMAKKKKASKVKKTARSSKARPVVRAKKVAQRKKPRQAKKVSGKRAAVQRSGHIAPLDLERIVELDFMRTTEAAALSAYRWLGKGNAKAAHAAAVDAVRGTLDLTSVSGTVLFGDGLDPLRGGLARGEKLGNWAAGTLTVALAAIPIDGVGLVARGVWGAMSLLVAARPTDTGQSGLMDMPCKYMKKIAYGPAVKSGPGRVNLDASVRDNLEIIGGKLGKRMQDLTVALMDRKENATLVHDIRKAGASARLFVDGHVACMMAPSLPDTGIDVYMSFGGAVEALVAAAAVKCLAGDVLARLMPQNAREQKAVVRALGKGALEEQFHADDMARGENIIFCATGISDGSILRGVHVDGNRAATSSVVMRSRYRTVRKVSATHDLSKKTIRRRSEGEGKL